MSEPNLLTAERDGDGIAVIFTNELNRNPLSVKVIELLENVFEIVENDTSINWVRLTGTNDVFASGADLNEIAKLTPETARPFALRGQRLMKRIEDLPIETIAFVNGYCFGGALDLALACDKRIASERAKFCHPGVGLGIITGWGGTQRLPRLIGEANAMEMFLTAEPIDANESLRIGLIDSIASDPKHL
ncbi:MAG: enoyl-CoA hydratase/isomerase family protein [Pyrinomonadaceae bacterium]